MQPITQRLQIKIPIRPKSHILLLLQSLDEWSHQKRRRTLRKWYTFSFIQMEVTRRLAIPIFNFSKDNLKNFISKETSEESIFTSTVLCSSNSKDSDRHDK